MQEKDFISYEYKTATAKNGEQAKAADLYEAFGWEITGSAPAFTGGVTLSLKRDRKLKHKQELNKLERKAEETLEAIGGFRKSQTRGARIFAILFGCLAALVLGGGMSLVMTIPNSLPAMVCGIFLGLVGIALCSVNYPIYRKMADKKTKELLPVIDDHEEKLANLLEQGNDLLRTEFI